MNKPKSNSSFEKVTRERIDNLLVDFIASQKLLNHNLEKLWEALDEQKILLHGRPSWIVTTIITFLVGLVVALITYVLR